MELDEVASDAPATSDRFVSATSCTAAVVCARRFAVFGLVQEAQGRKQLNPRDIAGSKARFSMTKATARGIQCRLTTCQCIAATVIIAQRALCITQCGLPLSGLPGTYLRAHATAVEQSPRNER